MSNRTVYLILARVILVIVDMDGRNLLALIAIAAAAALVGGFVWLLWLRQRPHLRSWTWPALVVTAGGAFVLLFVVAPPVTLWLLLGRP